MLSITSCSQDTLNAKLFCEVDYIMGEDGDLNKNCNEQDLSDMDLLNEMQSLF